MFQDPYASLDPRLDIARIVAEPLRIHGIGDAASQRAKASELLQAVGMDDSALDRYPHQFSGGQRQRIAIARALATSTRSAGLRRGGLRTGCASSRRDPGVAGQAETRARLALLFVTHDLAAASAVAERIAVLEQGRIVESGETATVLSHPQHPHTQALVAARPAIASL